MRLPAEFSAIQHAELTWILTHKTILDTLAHAKGLFLFLSVVRSF